MIKLKDPLIPSIRSMRSPVMRYCTKNFTKKKNNLDLTLDLGIPRIFA